MKKSRQALALTTLGTLFGAMAVAQAADYKITVTNLTTGIHFTPLIVSAHPENASMFTLAVPASAELQAIAEGGNTSGMATLLESIGASVELGGGLVAPGATATFDLSTTDAGNSVLSITGMLLPTNDGFVGLNAVPLPHDGSGTMTWFARGYDAGTEANDEIVGGGGPGEAGFPAPPPVVATGTGTGGTGINAPVEGFVSVHRGVLGDLDSTGGVSDINSAVHQWHNPIAVITATKVGGDDDNGVTAVSDLKGLVYSQTALEIFWQAASSDSANITGYEVRRNGELVETRDARSYFEEGLQSDTEYTLEVRAVDALGNKGPAESVTLTTNAQ